MMDAFYKNMLADIDDQIARLIIALQRLYELRDDICNQ